jgi:hypothetical protein
VKAIALLVLIAGAAHADARVYAGLSGAAQVVATQQTDYRRSYLGRGAGGGLFAGVHVRPWLALDLTSRATVHDERFAEARVTNLPIAAVAATTIALGPRLRWPGSRRLTPHARAAIGYAAIVVDFVECPACHAVFARGLDVELSGGLDIAIARRFWIGLQATGQLLHFRGDDFERRFRVASEPSRTRTTVASLIVELSLSLHF